MTTSDRTLTAERTRPCQDTTRPAAERVELLLAEMTLEEKVAQLGSRWVGADIRVEEVAVEDGTLNVAPMQDVFAAGSERSLADASEHGLGHLTRVYSGWSSRGPGSASRRWCTRSA